MFPVGYALNLNRDDSDRIGRFVMEDSVLRDLRSSALSLTRSPAFSFSAIIVLVLAIGACTTIFSVVEGVILRRLPFRDPNRLFVLWKTVPKKGIASDWASVPMIQDWYRQSTVFEDVALVLRPEGSIVIWKTENASEKLQTSKVSGNFFDLLGAYPLIGRTFDNAERQRNENVVVLSYGFWHQHFADSKGVVGHTLRLDNQDATVIGVMPPSFQFPDKSAQLWMLLGADSRWSAFQRVRIADAFQAVVRLKKGISIQSAQAQMNAVAQRVAAENPDTDSDSGIKVTRISDQVAGPQIRQELLLLGGAVFCVLLVACSNIASLQVARNSSRRRELAIRQALGASRATLLWHLTRENILIVFVSTLGAFLFAYVSLRML